MADRLLSLQGYGQSIWLDYISRSFLATGELDNVIKNDHVTGLTSNPSIFLKAIAKSKEYDQSIHELYKQNIYDANSIYEALVIKDIKDACDLLRATYEKSHGQDGFVSLEVSPEFAFDSQQTIEHGTRLYYQIDRPNLMIKVPGSNDGFLATRELIKKGINVNITLLFSLASYKEAAMAYLLGQQDRASQGLPIDGVKSVASFFISRIDSKVDGLLSNIINNSQDKKLKEQAGKLLGKTAILNAQLAYQEYQKIYKSNMPKSLLEKGLSPQRLLWASTSTKNDRYSDVVYVESLIGKNTVNTMPLETLIAFKDHGEAKESLSYDLEEVNNFIEILSLLGIKLFANAYNELLLAIDEKIATKKLNLV
jgi:transaldolase